MSTHNGVMPRSWAASLFHGLDSSGSLPEEIEFPIPLADNDAEEGGKALLGPEPPHPREAVLEL